MSAREHNLKIGVSGIRGVVGEFLTPALTAAFAQAFGTYVGAGRVVVGRDTRTSGEMIQNAVCCGLLAAGCDVVDVGILPTPTIQVYVGHTRAHPLARARTRRTHRRGARGNRLWRRALRRAARRRGHRTGLRSTDPDASEVRKAT